MWGEVLSKRQFDKRKHSGQSITMCRSGQKRTKPRTVPVNVLTLMQRANKRAKNRGEGK